MKTPSSTFLWMALLFSIASCKKAQDGRNGVPPVLGKVALESPLQEDLYTQTGLHYEEPPTKRLKVVDFFFTSCPTICPKMTSHLVTLQDHFAGNAGVEILSYSIDGHHDTPEVLEEYAGKYGIDERQWKLLTGAPETIFKISQRYKIMAFEDTFGEERNLLHDGTFVLIDGDMEIRGYYNGLDPLEVKTLIADMEQLLQTQ